MICTFSAMLLTAPLIGAPAPKAQATVDALVDLLPDDTAAIMVLDMPRLAKSPFGKRMLEVLSAQPTNLPWLDFNKLGKDVDLAVVGQFAIEAFAGDFCFLLRLREGSEIPKKLAEIAGDKPIGVGKAAVYSIHQEGSLYFAALDRNTIAVVMLCGEVKKESVVKEGLEAVFGAKRKGPRAELRKLLKGIDQESTIAIVSEHPKSANSALFAFSPFVQTNNLNEYKGKVVRFNLEIKMSDKAEVRAQVEMDAAATAEAVAKAVEDSKAKPGESPWQKEMAEAMKITRDKEKLQMRGSIAAKQLDLALPKN